MQEVTVYSFHFKDSRGNQKPHFLYTKGRVTKKMVIFTTRTSVVDYSTRVPASELTFKLSKKDCLDVYTQRLEDKAEIYRKRLAEVEKELSIVKYLDPDQLPAISAEDFK